jgi:transcriptional regulator NrdR family protein
MKCPQCGNTKQLTPESRRTETSVWRRRVCKGCHHTWLTQEQISPAKKMPTEVMQFLNNVVRKTPRTKPEVVEPKFRTEHLTKLPW